jgi:hypothetical protein
MNAAIAFSAYLWSLRGRGGCTHTVLLQEIMALLGCSWAIFQDESLVVGDKHYFCA